ncbi:hypothetical protein C7N43_06080 [Sphingobacteriales bacterium UPWRP_1]|nr:hypothetical protein C7N43_06080 [Sphingobacteriales bacterium UPWRP_1]
MALFELKQKATLRYNHPVLRASIFFPLIVDNLGLPAPKYLKLRVVLKKQPQKNSKTDVYRAANHF